MAQNGCYVTEMKHSRGGLGWGSRVGIELNQWTIALDGYGVILQWVLDLT